MHVSINVKFTVCDFGHLMMNSYLSIKRLILQLWTGLSQRDVDMKYSINKCVYGIQECKLLFIVAPFSVTREVQKY